MTAAAAAAAGAGAGAGMEGETQAAAARRRSGRLGVVATLAATVCWSFGGVLGKSVGASGVVITTWRLAMTAVLFNALLFVVGRRRLTVAVVRAAALGGVLFAANLAVFFTAIQHTSIAIAAVIGALTPVCILPGAALLGERLRPIVVICALVAVAGVVFSVLAGGDASGQSTPLGLVLAIVSLLLWVCYLLVTKRTRGQLDTLEYQAAVSTVAVVVMLPASLLLGENLGSVHGVGWLWLVSLAVIPGALGHGLVTWAQGHVDVSVSSVLIQGEPVGQTLTAAVFLGEAVTVGQSAAMAVVIAALAVLAWQTSGGR